MNNFFAHQKAVEFYKLVVKEKMPYYLKDQINRAASSVALNLAEGSGKISPKEQCRFYKIALGSVRECQSVLKLLDRDETSLYEAVDFLGVVVYRLIRGREKGI